MSSSVDWSQLYISAESGREPFEEVHVITAASECIRQAREIAFFELQWRGEPMTDDIIETMAMSYINDGKILIKEHVSVRAGSMSVCIATDVINDDTTWQVLDMVSEALDRLHGRDGRVNFGERITFTPADFKWVDSSRP